MPPAASGAAGIMGSTGSPVAAVTGAETGTRSAGVRGGARWRFRSTAKFRQYVEFLRGGIFVDSGVDGREGERTARVLGMGTPRRRTFIAGDGEQWIPRDGPSNGHLGNRRERSRC